MKHIAILLILFAAASCNTSRAIAQSDKPIYKISVGDTLLLYSGHIDRDNSCGDVIFFALSNDDSANFTTHYELSGGGVNYLIYFTPSKPGFFDKTFGFTWRYKDKPGCNYPTPSGSLKFLCDAVIDSSVIFLPYTYNVNLDVDTARELLLGSVGTRIHNRLKDTIIIDSIGYIGVKESLYSFSLDSSKKGISVSIPPSEDDQNLPIYIVTKDGPGYQGIPSYAKVYERIGKLERQDTLCFILSSPALCCQVNFIADSLHPVSKGPPPFVSYVFNVLPGQIADTTIPLAYTRFVKHIEIDTVRYPFSLTSVEEKPSLKILHLECHPDISDSSSASDAAKIHYTVRLFNGDSSSQNNLLFYFPYRVVPDLSTVSQGVQANKILFMFDPKEDLLIITSNERTSARQIKWVKIFNELGVTVRNVNSRNGINMTTPLSIDVRNLPFGYFGVQVGLDDSIVSGKLLVHH
jgi:hypothetical protein